MQNSNEYSNDDVYYVWLSLALGTNNPHSYNILESFENINEIYECKDYSSLKLPVKLVERLCDKDISNAIKIVEACRKLNIGILTHGSSLFPQRLNTIRSVPPVLYYKGNLINLNKEVCITFVGTRNPSDNGILNAECITFGCAMSGIIVVSGLAKGIDTACHRGALLAKKYNVGFSGVAIDKVFPSCNKYLYQEVCKRGVIFSEYPPGKETNRYSFPERNRLLAALSLGTVVVEAPAKSGSLITAELASEYGRMLFAVPGDISVSPGTNNLLAEGAVVVQSYKDVVKEYEYIYSEKLHMARKIDEVFPMIQKELSYFKSEPVTMEKIHLTIRERNEEAEKQIEKNINKNNGKSFSEKETIVVEILKKHKALSLDDIVTLSDKPFDQIVTSLTMLEIEGSVAQDANGRYMLS